MRKIRILCPRSRQCIRNIYPDYFKESINYAHSCKISFKFITKAIAAVCYITNFLLTKALDGKIHYETSYGKKTDLVNLCIFSYHTYVVDHYTRSKGKIDLNS